MLDLLGFSLLLLPFAFFWANCPCCGVTCAPCPDGVSSTVSVIFPELLPVDDCEYCEEFAEILFTLPFEPASSTSQCEWVLIVPPAERFCQTGVDEPPLPPNWWFIGMVIRVQVGDGIISLTIQSGPGGGDGVYMWIATMPDHDMEGGPCGPQTIYFEDPPTTTPDMGAGSYMTVCDFENVIPEVTFF